MRRVPLSDCPAVLDGPTSIGGQEAERAIDYYNAQPPPTKAFVYRAYKRAAVRDALNDAFSFRCAYCESQYGAVQPVDIEHYRPKGAIVTSTGVRLKPGYFWLAATWGNLLPSCIDCNRPRKQKGRTGATRLLGKGNHFPLIDEGGRARTPDADLSREEPLLLSPYADSPERHLEFRPDGIIRPAAGTGATSEDRRGRATIDLVGLNRPKLADSRAAHGLRVRMQLAAVTDAELNIAKDPDDATFRRQLQRELTRLKLLQDAESPYVTMTKQLIEAHKAGRLDISI
jgi:uncharacterized protein (TIGR02646 family)